MGRRREGREGERAERTRWCFMMYLEGNKASGHHKARKAVRIRGAAADADTARHSQLFAGDVCRRADRRRARHRVLLRRCTPSTARQQRGSTDICAETGLTARSRRARIPLAVLLEEGSDRAADDRGRARLRSAAARAAGDRAHVGQHRHRPRDLLRRARPPVCRRDVRGQLGRTRENDARSRRRGGAGAAVCGFGGRTGVPRTSRSFSRRRSASSPSEAPSAPINLSWTATSARTSCTRAGAAARRARQASRSTRSSTSLALAARGPVSPPHCARPTPRFAATASSQRGAAVIAGCDAPPLASHAIQGGGYGMAELTALAATPPPSRVYSGDERRGARDGAATSENRRRLRRLLGRRQRGGRR